jgi:hypothetical protein
MKITHFTHKYVQKRSKKCMNGNKILFILFGLFILLNERRNVNIIHTFAYNTTRRLNGEMRKSHHCTAAGWLITCIVVVQCMINVSKKKINMQNAFIAR